MGIQAYLKTLEIDVSQVRTLFTLLDVDRTGEVDIDEFVGGCLRLRGGATSMDLAVLKYQVEWIVRNLQSLQLHLGDVATVGVARPVDCSEPSASCLMALDA